MNKHLLIATAAAALISTSCKESSQFEGYKKSETGVNYKFFNHDESGVTPKEGDGVGITFTFKKQSNDSLLGDSKNASQDGSGVMKYILPKSSFVGSIEDGIMMMAKGDSASFIISADSFYLKNQKMQALPPGFKPGEQLKVNIKVVEMKSKKELEENQKQQRAEMEKERTRLQAEEKPAMDKYIADNKITARPTASGLIYIEEKKGKGAHPKPGDSVSVHYAGTLLNGEEFDNSFKRGEPISFQLGIGMVIPGWEEGIMLMTKGTKAKLLIPSGLAYGAQ
ncbi:MAG: FKBP-type peptidyl-prolyl cis-trans isomerase, partial [Bacteroidia bacterium]